MDSGESQSFEGKQKYLRKKGTEGRVQSDKETKLHVVPELKTLALCRVLSLLQMKKETRIEENLKSETVNTSK